jgi:phosphoglycolate phosphatase
LPAVAARNISAKFDYEFAPSQFIVLGDTPNDIACARHFGAKAVAVATGRNHPAETLVPHEPDYLLNDLNDTAEVLRILENL